MRLTATVCTANTIDLSFDACRLAVEHLRAAELERAARCTHTQSGALRVSKGGCTGQHISVMPHDNVDYAALTGLAHGRVTVEPSFRDVGDSLAGHLDTAHWPALFRTAQHSRAVRDAILHAATFADPDCTDTVQMWVQIARTLDSLSAELAMNVGT